MKRFSVLLSFFCLAMGSAWAGSNLYVLGEEINMSSSWTRSASSFVSGATGTITFNLDKTTITFTNVKIPSTNTKKVVHNKMYMMLEIVFVGECELYSKDKVIQYDASTTLDGSASTSVKMHSLWDEEVFYSNKGQSDTAADLTITGFPYLELWSIGDYCISHKKGQVNIKDSHVVMEGSKGTIHSNSFASTSFSYVMLTDCFYGGNYKWISTGDSRDVATATSDDKGDKVKKCVIIRSSEYSGVRVNGEPILASDSRWNASTNTVTLNASVNASSNFTYEGAITVEKSGVTIDGGGKSFTGKKYGMEVNLTSLYETATTRNIVLHGYETGLYGTSNSEITIGDNVTLYGVNHAIYYGKITFSPSSGKTVTLMPESGYAETVYGTLFQEKAIEAYSIQLNDCSTYPAGITVGGSGTSKTLVSGTTPWQQSVVIKGWEKFDLYVGGTQVNENNKDNLASLLSSYATGTLKFNPSTKTLTMNNLKASISSSSIPIYSQYGMGGMTILAEGENEITTSAQSSYVIYSRGDVTITAGTTSNKLTLKGAPSYAFIQAGKPIVKYITLNIEGNGNQLGIYNNVSNVCGSLSYLSLSIKNTSKPLAGMWATDSPLYGVIPGSEQDITFNPSSKELVYCDDYGPTTIPVTDDIAIYRMPDYTLTVSDNKPQSYTSEDGVCFDEFSRRLYLRNVRGTGVIVANIPKLKIHTIGNCEVSNSDCPLYVWPETLIFQGPGTLTLTSPNGNAAQIWRRSTTSGNGSTVQVNNTILKLKGMNGMVYSSNSSLLGKLSVTGSRVEINSNSTALFGFSSVELKNCTLYTPQGGYYSDYRLHNADGNTATNMLILPETPEEIALDAHANNDSFIFSNYGKEGIVTINNLTIKGNGTWRTICLPFNVRRIGSVLQNCDIREYSKALSRQQGDIEILDFTTSVSEMKANVPYIIRNTSGTDIVNPNFGYVKLAGSKQSVYMGISLGGSTSRYFAGSYAQYEETGVYVLWGGNMELSHRDRYTMDAFEACFNFGRGETGFKVIYTGSSEDELIDGIHEIKNEELRMKNEGEWYSLDGCKLSGKPTKAGIYINGGRKVVVK